jgi:hypothetical protein
MCVHDHTRPPPPDSKAAAPAALVAQTSAARPSLARKDNTKNLKVPGGKAEASE